MTMETAQQDRMNDEFGYQRFALTEVAYDLISSLAGIYVRLWFAERQKLVPNQVLIEQCQQRAYELRAIYQ